jgi:hypothetical protein
MECGETALALDDALFFPAWRPDDQGLEMSLDASKPPHIPPGVANKRLEWT